MSGQRVTRQRTNVSEQEMANAIKEAWLELFGYSPSKQQIAMLMAQNSLETGNRKSMWNYNVGNITTSGKTSDFYDDLTTDEQIKPGVWEKRNLKYRSYKSLKDGVKDYIRLISNGRYAKAWEHVVNPNPVAFSKGLKAAGYYTANEAPYTKGLTSLYKQYANKSQYSNEKSTDIVNNVVKMKPTKNINDMLNQFLKLVADNKVRNCLIKLNSNNINDSLEFARILSLGISEELGIHPSIHFDGKNVDVYMKAQACVVPAVKQFAEVLSDVFAENTKAIDTSKINITILNKKSTLDLVDVKVAERNHRNFLIRFAEKHDK